MSLTSIAFKWTEKASPSKKSDLELSMRYTIFAASRQGLTGTVFVIGLAILFAIHLDLAGDSRARRRNQPGGGLHRTLATGRG